MPSAVFMGTPQFAVPTLEALYRAGYEIKGVFTQPDRPAGRGKKLTACPVKQKALELGLPVYQFERIKRPEGVAQLRALAPDVAVTAAFGQILSQELLDIPKYGTVNVHASLLPAHRGSAPINWAILRGDEETGVTTMLTDAGIDTGDMLLCERTPVGEDETAEELAERLSHIGADLLVRTLEGYLSGKISPRPQSEEGATYDPMLKKEMGNIDWSGSACEISRQVRGLTPWPGTFTWCPLGLLKIWGVKARPETSDAAPGTVIVSGQKEGLLVSTGQGTIELTEIQAPGSRRMPAKAWLAGHDLPTGTLLTQGEEPRA